MSEFNEHCTLESALEIWGKQAPQQGTYATMCKEGAQIVRDLRARVDELEGAIKKALHTPEDREHTPFKIIGDCFYQVGEYTPKSGGEIAIAIGNEEPSP